MIQEQGSLVSYKNNMNEQCELFQNVDKIHTTLMGIERIQRNLGIEGDVVLYCKRMITKEGCQIERKGKNYYASIEGCVFTINAYSYTIITAHKSK